MKVFLGGTCPGWDWRAELQPMLKCDYYNPIVDEWDEEHRLREVQERETSDFVLYVITDGIVGVYSIAEVVDDSNKRPEKTLFCNLFRESGDAEDRAFNHSLKAVQRLLESNGVKCFDSLESIAVFLNNTSLKRRFEDYE